MQMLPFLRAMLKYELECQTKLGLVPTCHLCILECLWFQISSE